MSAFDVSTASTNGVGVATVTVSPKSASSNGADQIVASATVGGVPISDSVVVQVTSSTLSAPPVLNTSLSSTSISSATPAVVTSTLTDGKGQPAPGQVVTFSVVRGLAKTNVATALTDSAGNAVVVLSPINSTIAGADEVQALANFAGSQLQSTKGFQIQATNVSLSSFTSAVASLGAYGQTTLTIGIVGASIGSPVNVSVTSSCVSQGKATLSPSTFTATTATVDLQFKDNGCGALQLQDKLQASITGGSGAPVSLSLPIVVPSEASLAFISASPEVIFLKGSGFTETSTLTFEVRDRAGNPLPQRTVDLALLTAAGGVTIEGGPGPVALASDAAGRVSVRVNSGTVPTPIRVRAALHATPSIATVSSNLSVAVGLPSQLNFSMSQTAMNIEGMNLDGTPNAYNIIASDRSGNPVPAGTSINFVTEGGQVESIKQIQLVSGLARTSAGFISSAPRPDDGRIVVVAYALGEESFIDQNGNNTYDVGEPFQDLGSIYKDRIYDGIFDAAVDEYIPTGINNTSACSAAGAAAGATAVTNALLALDVSIPSIGASSCDGKWSGAGQVYVRRAVETVLSTSTPRALWSATTGLDAACSKIILQNGPSPASSGIYTVATGTETWYSGSAGVAATSLNFLVADANTFKVLGPSGQVGRLNPMAAGTTITAGSATSGVIVKVYGDTVPSTTEATGVSIGVDLGSASSAPVSVTFTSPVSKTATSYTFTVTKGIRPSACP